MSFDGIHPGPSLSADDEARTKVGHAHVSLGAHVADRLRTSILEGLLPPGARLVEDRLSGELGVSRVPIREALRALAREGLIELRPRRGAYVAEMSASLLRDLVEVRATLEGLNARLAARNHDQTIALKLNEVLAVGNAAVQTGSAADLMRLNSEFHDALAQAGRNEILWDIMRSLRERTNLMFSANGAGRAVQDWAEHSTILAAVLDRDEELAAMLAMRHVRRAANAALVHVDARETDLGARTQGVSKR